MSSPRWPYYLPVNPYCGCGTCGSNPCSCDPCTNPQSDITRQSSYIIYTGASLPCLGIDTNDTLETIIQKIEEKFCALATFVGYTTTTTSTTAAIT